jgi:hypothetical protein
MTPRIVVVPDWLLFWAAAFTLGQMIVVRRAYKDDPVLLAHETIHTLQYRREGLLKFLFLYVLVLPFGWNPWRARWEAEAYAVNVRAGRSVSSCAKTISGAGYLWPCRLDRAAELINSFAWGKP